MTWLLLWVLAQPIAPSTFDQNASDVFGNIAREARSGFRGDRRFAQQFMERTQHLRPSIFQAESREPIAWEGKNSTGRVYATSEMPDLTDNSRDSFWVSFEPADERPMPAPIVAALLAEAEKTQFTGGDELTLVMRTGSAVDGLPRP